MPSISTGPDAPGDAEDELTPQQDPLDCLLRDAAARLLRTDKLSTYERRVAIRELTDLIQRAYVELGEPVPASLGCQANSSDTARAFATLINELDRVNERRASLATELQQSARQMVAAWDALGYAPRDALELRVWRYLTEQPGAEPLRPSTVLADTLQAVAAVWTDAKLAREQSTIIQACHMTDVTAAVRAALAAACVPDNVAHRIIAYDFSPARVALVEAAAQASGDPPATLGTFLTHGESSSGCAASSHAGEAVLCAARALTVLRRIEGSVRRRAELLRQSLDPLCLCPTVTLDSPDVFDYIDRMRAFADRLRIWELAAGCPFYADHDCLRALGLPSDSAPAPLAVLLLKAADELDRSLDF